MLLLQGLQGLHVSVPDPGVLLCLAVVWSACRGGLVPGLLSAAIAVLYDLGRCCTGLASRPDDVRRLVFAVIGMPSAAFLAGRLRSRLCSKPASRERSLGIRRKRSRAGSGLGESSSALSTCAWCRRARTRDGQWVGLEDCLATEHGIALTHGICPDCAPALQVIKECRGGDPEGRSG